MSGNCPPGMELGKLFPRINLGKNHEKTRGYKMDLWFYDGYMFIHVYYTMSLQLFWNLFHVQESWVICQFWISDSENPHVLPISSFGISICCYAYLHIHQRTPQASCCHCKQRGQPRRSATLMWREWGDQWEPMKSGRWCVHHLASQCFVGDLTLLQILFAWSTWSSTIFGRSIPGMNI